MEENQDVRVMNHSSVDEARNVLVRRGVAQRAGGAPRLGRLVQGGDEDDGLG